MMADFSETGDDVKGISQNKFDKLNRYEKFEK